MSVTPPELRALVDDPEGVLDADTVLRVVPPSFFSGREVQSNAYQDQTLPTANEWGLAGPCASVNVRRIWEEEGADIEKLLEHFHEGSGLVEIAVSTLRALTSLGPEARPLYQGVMLDPRPNAPWHAVMFPLDGGMRSRPAKKALQAAATWFWHPLDHV